ncbi:MAG: hypothetical protein AAFR81_16395 [Chloroflexota bacterium]
MSKIPIICDLSALPDRDQHQQITASLFAQTITLTETDTGYQINLPITTLKLVADFIDGERRCCPFLHFEITVFPVADTLQLHIKGDSDAKALLQRELLAKINKKS